jgi:uncharacterized protein YndB with AHSA1/START domain
MATFHLTTLVAAPPSRVFDAWTDLDRFHEWIGGVARGVWFGRMASREEVIEVERPSHIRTRFGNMILKGETDVTFTPDGDGTRIRQVLQTRGFVSAVFGRIFATGSYEGSFKGELERFRELVESES